MSKRVKRNAASVLVRAPTATVAAPAWRTVLQQAMQAHQADELDTAERLYREVLDLRVLHSIRGRR